MKKWLTGFLIAITIAITVTAFPPRKITWVAIGDSITYLNEHRDETGNRITKGYMTRVTEKLPHIHYINKGYNGWTSGGIADAIEKLDLYHNSGITLGNMVKYKRLKDPATGKYRDYQWPDYKDIPFHPGTDEYPYPVSAIDMTYDGLHLSDKGFAVIADMLVKIMKRY
ncbi:SGNH/GDSL hydrolase family protein [Chitinophaga polysaccharea]|uniref:SGNH/GDSL hydrolase family protein n=1 Tax=Chitinophaga polysaccharea TaxID=1293035 RepID=UPI001157C07D|nr:SGNH/GDSL hydrolase family protein [Chitinophaga polysaccharea]